jgi:predicted restriction endonuclease
MVIFPVQSSLTMKKRRLRRHKSYVPFFKRRRRYKKSTRNWDDPRYVAWRQKVFKKDNYECSICGSNYNLEAHHLASWSKYPQYRYLVRNGRLLCKHHHDQLHKLYGKITTTKDYIAFRNKYGKT